MGLCSFIYWVNCFLNEFSRNKTTLFVLGIIIFMLLGIRIGNTVFWNERKVDGWTGMLIPCMLAAIVTNIEHEYYQLHFWLIIVLTILSVLYISTVVLTYIAHEKVMLKELASLEDEHYFGACQRWRL